MLHLSLVTTWIMLVRRWLQYLVFSILSLCGLVVDCLFVHTLQFLVCYTLILRVCQGMKIVKFSELPHMWDYRKKQEGKIKSLESLAAAAKGAHQADAVEDTPGDGRTKRAMSAEMRDLS